MNSRRLYRRLNDIFSKISEEDYPEIYNIIENELDFQMRKSMRKPIILQENYMKQMAQRFYLHVWLILLWKSTKKN